MSGWAACLQLLRPGAAARGRRFVVEVPDGEVFEAAEQPEDLLEIAEVMKDSSQSVGEVLERCIPERAV